MKARKGSTHGYDIVDHTKFNPELGGEAGFERLSAGAEAARSRPDPRFRSQPCRRAFRRQSVVARRAGMGPGLAACGLVRHRLGHLAVPGARRRAAADHRLVLWRGAGKGRDRAALRCRRRQFFGLVFRASPADRAGALQRDPAHDRQGSRRRRQRGGKAHSRPRLALQGIASSQSQGSARLQGGAERHRRKRRDHRARARRLSGRTGSRRADRWRCIICWNASTTSSATGGSPPATSTIGAFSTSIRWPDCGSRMPAPSTPSIAWSRN